MKRFIVLLFVAGAAAGSVYGAAATLGGLTSQSVAADVAQLTPCDSNGVSIGFSVSPGTGFYGPLIASFTVKHVDDDCAGKYWRVAFYAADDSLLEASTVNGVLPSPLVTGGADDREFSSSPVSATPVKDVASVSVEISDLSVP